MNVQPVRYLVTELPPEMRDARLWGVYVEWRGSDLWAVVYGDECLNRDGQWVPETSQSTRNQANYRSTRFSFDEAIEKAKQAVGQIEVNGITATQVKTMVEEQEAAQNDV